MVSDALTPYCAKYFGKFKKNIWSAPPIQSTGNVWKTKIAAQETIRKVYIEKD